jgi:hypothetical protein
MGHTQKVKTFRLGAVCMAPALGMGAGDYMPPAAGRRDRLAHAH